MTSRLGKHLRAKSKTENFRLFALYSCYFFICCLTAPWLTFGYYWGNSLTHLMLITAFGLPIFGPRVTWRDWVSTPNLVPSGLWSQWHKPLAHSAQIAENTLPRLAPRFSKMRKCPNTQKSYSLTLWWPLGLHNTSLDAKFSVQNFSFCWSVKSMS